MFSEKKEGIKKKRTGIAVGYDLSDSYAQISYCQGGEEEAETLSLVTGSEQYNIPLALCKRKGANQWFYGKEALKFAAQEDGVMVENLLTLARMGERVEADGEEFDPLALLTLFIRRSLSLLHPVALTDEIAGLMFTVDELDKRMVEVLAQVSVNLGLKTAHIFFQSHRESFYCYNMEQQEELWTYDVLLCDYDYRNMKTYTLNINRRTTPKVAFIESAEYKTMEYRTTKAAEGAGMDEFTKKRLDESFLEIVKGKCNGRAVSCVYLIGEGYKEDWAAESLRYLCRGRRVFQGNNLYSKGACYGARRKLYPTEKDAEYVFLGTDKLKANVGMRILRRGLESYYAVMDAGVNWYEAKREFEVILENGDTLSVILTPLNGKQPREIHMILEEIPVRPDWTTRLKIQAEMISENEMSVKVEDMGFGEIFAPSGGEWTKVFEIV